MDLGEVCDSECDEQKGKVCPISLVIHMWRF